jgi:hypothetical protein
MFLLGIYFENVRKIHSGRILFPVEREAIPKWNILPAGPSTLELLQLMALSCGGAPFIKMLPYDFRELSEDSGLPVRIEFILAPHPDREGRYRLPKKFGSGLQIEGCARIRGLTKKECRLLPRELPVHKPAFDTGNSRFFVVGYGSSLAHHDGTDDFDFTYPYFRTTRFHSLFSPKALLTDPVAFLRRLNYRAAAVSRYPARWTMQRICDLLGKYLHIDASSWLKKGTDFPSVWAEMRPWQRRTLLPTLDAVRHIIDASPFVGRPLEIHGVMIMERPDRLCSEKIFPSFVRLLNELFPAMQFVVTLSGHAKEHFPGEILVARLKLPQPAAKKPAKVVSKVASSTIVLIHVDGRLPNLALMKLSRHFKKQGRNVHLARKEIYIRGAEEAYASCIFSTPVSQKRIRSLRDYYGQSFIAGGSGVDVHQRLPEEIENLPADYSLYPELGDRAIGFLTRGCTFSCPFCIVPKKEGRIRQVSDLDELLDSGRRKKLILLDDNILSHPEADNLLARMAGRNLQVNFNQTLDIRLVDRERADILQLIACSNVNFTRRVIHFSLNDTRNLDRVRRNYSLFSFTPADNVEFICMYGFNTTLAEDVERFRFLRSLPGAYVFVQEYQPIPRGPAAYLENFFDDSADRLIEELIGICFPQNMKSMEKYYRWLSKRYVQTFGRLHRGLVDTIFRYNQRDRKGRYLQTLAGTLRNGLNRVH